jgi:xanthine phosphoribosyltransferase
MEPLRRKIQEEGKAIGTDIIKVDNFLNHQIDISFLREIGKELGQRFGDLAPNKIVTVESSGIAIACETARYFGDIPVLFAKKAAPNTLVEGYYCAPAKSFTKGIVSTLRVSKNFLGPDDRVLIVDDFLAYGEAAMALCELCRQSGAQVLGIGAVIEKEFQGGSKRLREKGYRVEALAVIQSIQDGKVIFQAD